MVNKGRGIYVWLSKPDDPVAIEEKGNMVGDLLLIRILKISDDRMLVMNPDDTKVYTLKEIEW